MDTEGDGKVLAVDRAVKVSDSFADADEADDQFYAGLTPEQRLEILLELVERHRSSLGWFVVCVVISGFLISCQSSSPSVDPPGPPYQVISGGPVKPPVALHRVMPKRPEGVAEKGEVLLKTIVGLDGIARDIEVIKAPHVALGEVSAEAAKQWRFTPGTLRGKQVETIFFIQMKF